MAAAQGDFSIPEGFPTLLKDFAKEVLRAQARPPPETLTTTLCLAQLPAKAVAHPMVHPSQPRKRHGAGAQPANVCAFAATYFADLARRAAAPGASAAPEQRGPQSPTAEEAFLVARRLDTQVASAAAGLAGVALEVRWPRMLWGRCSAG